MKKVLSIIVALSMLLTFAVPAAFALGETGYSDVDGTNYEGAVSILSNLGIMTGYEDGSFRPYSTVTRAEMAAISLHMRGIFDYGDRASIEEVRFNDMDGHWAEAAVAYARALGIIDGYEDGYFYPDEPITYEQAIKIIISTLGYEYYAELNGGYPSGYLAKANELKITSGVGLTVGSYITRGDLAKILYNSLTVDIMQDTKYTNSEVTYTVTSGDTILNTYFDVTKLHGIVEANDSTGLYGEATAKEGQVKIGDELFNAGSTGIADYLGYYVTFYALEDDSADVRTIIAFKAESSKNNYIKLDAENIENVTLSSSRYVFEYRSGNKTKTVRTSNAPLLIYNGVALVDFSAADLAPECGQITLLDNNGDGIYDIIDILSYDIMLVLNVSEATGNVVAAYSTGIRGVTLDAEDEDYSVRIIDGNGNKVPFNSIQKNSVINAAISRDSGQTVRTVIVSNDSVTGTIDGLSADGYFTINGVEYETVSYMMDTVGLSIGDSGTFFLTYDGKIAGFDGETKISKNMGMYIAYYSGTYSEGGDQIKILKSDGTIGIYNLAKKVTLNGESYSGSEVFSMIADTSDPLFGNLKTESDTAGKIIADPSKSGILYRVNSSGQISEIVTATAEWGTDDAEDAELSVRASSGMSSSYYYSTKYRCFHRSDVKTYVTDNTVIFGSDDKESKENVDSNIYYVNTASSYYNNQDVYYPATYFYYINNKSYADFAVFYDNYDKDVSGTDSSINEGITRYSMYDAIKVVDRVIETYDSEHEMTYRLVYWESGTSKAIDFYENKNSLAYRDGINLWRRGDMVNIVKTSGKITDIESIFKGNVAWNNPTDVEAAGGKEKVKRYDFPLGVYEYWSSYDTYYTTSLVQRYIVGRVTSIDTLKYFSTFDIDAHDSQVTGEPLENNCYRLIYDNNGYLTDVKDVGIGAVAEDQLVLVRKNGTNGTLSCRVAETYILYEPSEFTDDQILKYASVYPELAATISTQSVSTQSVNVAADDVEIISAEPVEAILNNEEE